MAVLKHIALKNKNYFSAYMYLTYEYDEFKMIPLKDENNQMIPRTDMLIDSINCESPITFAAECIETNSLYHKNKLDKDIKAHHYIISYDPKDVTDNGLTVDKAQALSMDFARKNFPGHQMIVATHSDGHNQSGNIHSHIVLNSVRKFDIERTPFTERDTDLLAGKKHHVSDKFLTYLKKDLMELCEENSLNQIDIVSPSKIKVSESEYHLYKRQILSGNTSFRSTKDIIREMLYDALMKSKTYKQYLDNLYADYGIICYEKNNHLYYEFPDDKRPVNAKRFGSFYDFDNVTTQVAVNNRFVPTEVVHYNAPFVLTSLIDIANNQKAQESINYKRKLEVLNTQIKARTLFKLSSKEDASLEALEEDVSKILEDLTKKTEEFKSISSELKDLNTQIKYTGQYWAYKDVYEQYISLKGKKKDDFYKDHESEIILFKTAKDKLIEKRINNKLPSVNALKEKKEALLSKKESLYEEKMLLSKEYKEAKILLSNTRAIIDNTNRVPLKTVRTTHDLS